MSLGATVLAGYSVFVAGQLTMRVVVEPIHELRRHIGRVSAALTMHRLALTASTVIADEHVKEMREDLRSLASEFAAHPEVVPFYKFWELMRILPPLEAVYKSQRGLIALSKVGKHSQPESISSEISQILRQLRCFDFEQRNEQ